MRFCIRFAGVSPAKITIHRDKRITNSEYYAATAVLAEVEGRKLTFNVGARDAEGLIGEGIHIRYIVDREKFMAKVK